MKCLTGHTNLYILSLFFLFLNCSSDGFCIFMFSDSNALHTHSSPHQCSSMFWLWWSLPGEHSELVNCHQDWRWYAYYRQIVSIRSLDHFTSCLVNIKIKLEAILRWDHTRRQTGQGCKILAPYSRPPRSDHAHFRPSFWCQRHICKVLWVCPARLCHADWLKTCSVVVPATVGVIRTKWHTLTHKLKTTPVVTVAAGKNSGCYCGAAQSSRLYGP